MPSLPPSLPPSIPGMPSLHPSIPGTTCMHQGLSNTLSVKTKMKLVQRATISSNLDSSSLQCGAGRKCGLDVELVKQDMQWWGRTGLSRWRDTVASGRPTEGVDRGAECRWDTPGNGRSCCTAITHLYSKSRKVVKPRRTSRLYSALAKSLASVLLWERKTSNLCVCQGAL